MAHKQPECKTNTVFALIKNQTCFMHKKKADKIRLFLINQTINQINPYEFFFKRPQ